MRRMLIVGSLAIAFTGLAFACSLDLDESLIEKKKDGGLAFADANLPDGTVISESGVPIIPDAAACAKDEDCLTTNACLKGKCDLARKACAYDICRPTACNSGTCDTATRTCSTPAPYKLKAASIALDQPVTGSIIAAYPWLFTLTATGVLAYNVSNPSNEKPLQVPVVGIGFVPNQMTRSGNRIWIGAPLAGAPARLPLAYIDVPADPFTTKIQAQTVLPTYSRPATESVGLAARENKSLMLIGPAPTFPTAVVDTLISEPATATATPLAPTVNTSPASVSGSRLLMHSIVAGVAGFNFINNAGSTAPTTGESVTINDVGEVSVARAFAAGVDGAVFWATGVHQPGPIGLPPGGPVTRAVRGYFLVASGTAALDAAVKGIDIEVYKDIATAPPANADILRAPAMLDDSTAMVATAAAENVAALTAIQFIKRDPLALVPGKRLVITAAITSVVASSASDGIGYVAVNEPSGAPDVAPTGRVYVIDPACAP